MNLLIQNYGINNLYFFISYSFLGVIFNLRITNLQKVNEVQKKLKIIQKRIIKYLLIRLKFNFFIWSKY